VLEALPFTYLHVFPYSARPGTAAPRLGAPVPDADIKRRAAELRAIGRRREGAYAESRAGGVADVVTLTAGTGGEGLSEDYLSVLLPVSLPRRTRVTCQLLADPSGRLRAEPTAPRNDRD
jgi:threonylcarbamoyladenosine tRNA methylthiotransferase MtaB